VLVKRTRKLNKAIYTYHQGRVDGHKVDGQHSDDKMPHISALSLCNLEHPTRKVILCGKQLRNAGRAGMKKLLTGLSGHSFPCAASCLRRSLIRGSKCMVPHLMSFGIFRKREATNLGNEVGMRA
jgi:hypothetical protein